jgi:hypothetical protein
VRLAFHFVAYQTLTLVPHSRLKRQKIGHSIHKRLGEVMAMSRQERQGMKLSEAIKHAPRRHIPILPVSSPLAGNVANRELEHSNETENGV